MSVPAILEIDGRADVGVATDLLLDRGALIVRGAASAASMARIEDELRPFFERTPFSVGRFYGDRTVRFGRIFARSEGMRALGVERLVYGIAAGVLGRWHRGHSISFAQAIAVHPQAPMQAPHRDGEMWPVVSSGEHLVSVMWPLTRFGADNGGTVVWPRGADAADVRPPSAVMSAGDALLFLGSTTHAAGANPSGEVRRGIVVGYGASWLVPAENPILANPPAVASHYPRELAELLGYRRLAPNLNNYDCRCPSELLEGIESLGAVDELHPEQIAGLERFYAAMGSPA